MKLPHNSYVVKAGHGHGTKELRYSRTITVLGGSQELRVVFRHPCQMVLAIPCRVT